MVEKTIPVRELNQNTSAVLALVKKGERVVITERGRPIARLEPTETDPLRALRAQGWVVPATTPPRLPRPSGAPAAGSPASQAVVAGRDEERW